MRRKIQSLVPRILAVVLVAASATLAGATWAESGSSSGSGSRKLVLFLTSTGADPNATAKVTFFPRTGHELLRVELRGLTAGPYDLLVGGSIVATITIKGDDSGSGERTGRLRLQARNGRPLGFDPLGRPMQVVRDGVVYFDDTIPSAGGSLANVDFSIGFVNAGVFPEAHGDVRLRIRNGRMDFSVGIEDVPAGEYAVRVAGVNRGSFTASSRPGRRSIRGEAEFSNDPHEVGHLLLTFDPRGQLVEVLQGTTVLLSVTLPSAPPAL